MVIKACDTLFVSSTGVRVTYCVSAQKTEGVCACPTITIPKKGKDVDLYSAIHALCTPNALTSLKLGRQTAILGHRQACKPSPCSDPITGTGNASQQ